MSPKWKALPASPDTTEWAFRLSLQVFKDLSAPTTPTDYLSAICLASHHHLCFRSSKAALITVIGLGPIDNDNAAMISRIRQVLVDLLWLGLFMVCNATWTVSEQGRISLTLCLLTDNNGDYFNKQVFVTFIELCVVIYGMNKIM